MTPMDELSARQVLASYERAYELALKRWRQTQNPADWERQNDLARIIRGHCMAYHLVPAVDVGVLT